MELFEGNLLKGENRPDYQLVGQVFDTYWIVQQEDRMYIIDQHAAHERVLYEKTLQSMKTREFTSQMISPPIILNLTMQESDLLKKYMDRFTRIGFEFEEFRAGILRGAGSAGESFPHRQKGTAAGDAGQSL